MKALLIFIGLLLSYSLPAQDIKGAWSGSQEGIKTVMIFAEGFFSVSQFRTGEFLNTWGGKYFMDNNQVSITLEFSTVEPVLIGTSKVIPFSMNNEDLSFNNQSFNRIDNGNPGTLAGAWIITGRERDGEMTSRPQGPRKTMKILSGKRFQWIAYNIATQKFLGTGGGTYTTENGIYVENIYFFSRDNDRVGASLNFDYELIEGEWHHKGLSSKGQPIYEIWSIRKD